MSKVVQICHRYPPFLGGIEKHVKEISEKLVERDWRVEVVTGNPGNTLPPQEVKNGVIIKRFPVVSPKNSYHLILGLGSHLKKSNHDIIHAHGYHALPAFQTSLHTDGSNFVFTPHYKGFSHSAFRSLLHQMYKPFGKGIFRKAKKVVCVSSYEKNLIQKNFEVQNDRLTVIPNGVNLKQFRKPESEFEPNSIKTVLSVGRLEKYKNMQELIKALPLLPSNIHLEIVGEGPLKNHLLELSENLDVAERTHFFEDLLRNELIKKYKKSDVFVLLSKYEAYGVVVGEAIAAGTPCIVSDVTALSEWIDDEICFGIDLPVDKLELSRLIERVARKEFENRENEKLKTWSQVVDSLEGIYTDISEDGI